MIMRGRSQPPVQFTNTQILCVPVCSRSSAMPRPSCSRPVPAPSLGCLPWISGFLLHTLLSTELRCAAGLQVTSTGPQTVQKAQGESATLGCSYSLSPSDTGDLDIEWSVLSPDTTQKDRMLMSFSGGIKYEHGGGGLSFAAADPSFGDASLSISRLSPAHSATYQCKVKKSPGVDSRKVSLLVLVKPTVPKCWVEGGEEEGEAVALRCQSAQGSAPLTYSWRREHPPAATVAAVAAQDAGGGGELRISNLTRSLAGLYLCEVNNAVGAERCRINLKAKKPANRVAVMVGTAVGSLLLLIVLLIFVGILYWKMTSRLSQEKEFSNEIREDVPPPESRPASRLTTRSINHQPPVSYSRVGGGETELSSFSDTATRPPASSTRPVASPTRPVASPTRPAASSTRPVASPTRPAASSTHPVASSTPVGYDSTYGYAV